MKFAKELEREAVPEWRIKYLNYKAGKKYVKAIARAINRANATPHSLGPRTPSVIPSSQLHPVQSNTWTPAIATRPAQLGRASSATPESGTQFWTPSTQPIPPARKRGEDESLKGDGNSLQYGSFVPTPPDPSPLAQRAERKPFSLPGPAMHAPDSPDMAHHGAAGRKTDQARIEARRSATLTSLPGPSASDPRSLRDQFLRRPASGTFSGERLSPLRHILSQAGGMGSRDQTRSDVSMRNFDLVREREREFWEFLDSELDKVEAFYKLKEEQAAERLVLLREQLHEMRNRRIRELSEPSSRDDPTSPDAEDGNGQDKFNHWVQPIKAKIFPPGPNSKAFQSMLHTPHLAAGSTGDATRDYIRRPHDDDVPYRTAKRKLKLALQEFYRSLELLKSYALLNRTAFRKLNKKYDKAVNARPAFRYMNEKVHKAWFVNSDIVDGHLQAVEDLYARYFERGNHKLAAGKLRGLSRKSSAESGSSFLNGFLIGTGLVFSIQGLISGVELLDHSDPTMRQQTSYLLQIYGGYFLMLLMMGMFCINCLIWQRNKINYPFIFELDQRHQLDWRRIAEFPSFFLLLFGILLWLNFSEYRDDNMFLYYPVLLIGITVTVIFLPGPVLAHNSRRWFATSHGRLLLAGIYGVEFRDFFLGDIYCSLTYAMANIELFFCLYARDWNDPPQCNSSHSRLLGFLTALPPIWRFFQCIRRYKDTRNVFPHLVNCGKYTMSIMAAVTLSMYRINGSGSNFGLFLTFSIINGIYCSIWDLFMDFSLLQTHSRHIGLRDILALKSKWPYYTILVVDPILRFSWIFYAIFTHNRQHSTIVSFLVALVEVFRRCWWAIFRVENEHCANVSQYKASRDVPLPYRIEPLMDRASCETSPMLEPNGQPQQQQQQRLSRQRQDEQSAGHVTASSTAVASSSGTVRRRPEPLTRSFSKIMAEAHKQDFEKKRRPVDGEGTGGAAQGGSDDEDEDEDSSSLYEERQAEELRRRDQDSATMTSAFAV